MVDLVTLQDAKERLGITFATQDDKILQMTRDATGIVLDYIGNPEQAWSVTDVPGPVRSAIFMVTARLYANDGDQVITDAVRRVLRRFRKPVVA